MPDRASDDEALQSAATQAQASGQETTTGREIMPPQLGEHESEREILRHALAELEIRVTAAFKAHSDFQHQSNEQQIEKDALRGALAGAENRLAEYQNTIDSLQQRIEELERSAESLHAAASDSASSFQQQLGNLVHTNASLQNQIAQFEHEGVALQKMLSEAEARSAQLIKSNESLQGQILTMQPAAVAFRKSAEDARYQETQLDEYNQRMTLLGDMENMVRACRDFDEIIAAIAQGIEPVFPGQAGAVYFINPGLGVMEPVSEWGWGEETVRPFALDECFALRRNRPHAVKKAKRQLLCKHVNAQASNGYICVPMIAGREILGMLHLGVRAAGAISELDEKLACVLTEYLAAILAPRILAERSHS